MSNDLTSALTEIGVLRLGGERAAVIRGALASGFLAQCREEVSEESLSAATGLGVGRVRGLCAVLCEFGVLDRGEGGDYVLSPLYALLFDADADRLATGVLEGAAVRGRLLEGLFTSSQAVDYQDLPDAERAAVAAGVTVDPFSLLAHMAMGALVDAVPGWRDRFEADGTRLLELGCGVAGGLLTWLQMYPGLTAVGIDLADDLIDIAQARAKLLGVAERVTFVTGDATAYADASPFDCAHWSQFFFPQETRKAALANAFARLRPQGLLIAPVLPSDQFALNSVLLEAWDVPALTAEELVAEFEAAGFGDAEVVPTLAATVVAARRP
ncbi:class I SAM-dependent methyltransferase [Streptomyces sp. NPDC048281]|uniref:SAM-dependent methyltransferase n=1 Tax=Streptomyces sp. NPDC048281 TaxID=3154715 RepID=UPI00341B5C19